MKVNGIFTVYWCIYRYINVVHIEKCFKCRLLFSLHVELSVQALIIHVMNVV